MPSGGRGDAGVIQQRIFILSLKIDVKISKPPDDFRRFYRFKEIPAASEKVRLQITQPIFDILITMCYDLYIKLFMPAGLLF